MNLLELQIPTNEYIVAAVDLMPFCFEESTAELTEPEVAAGVECDVGF
jgi:hypothetical protein